MEKKLNLFARLLVLLLFLPAPLLAQTLRGHIYDAKTNEPLAGATVSYKLDGAHGTVADLQGAYELQLPEGGVDLVYSYVGYDDAQVPVVVGKRAVLVRDVYLHESTKLLQEVVVTAGRFEQRLSDVTVSMQVLKAGEIQRQAPTDITATLKTLPGIDVVDKQPSIRGGGGWTYGVGARSLVLVDGMSTLNPQNGEINWNTVALENIEQVEVIKGASSVLYGSSALNGIINIRTARPGLTPVTHAAAYAGIYGNNPYAWADKDFWREGKFPVKPLLRSSLFSGVRNPLYEGFDLSHTRRIGHFDVSGGMNLFTDEGYRQQGYNQRFRIGGNLTYHHPLTGGKLLNYGFDTDFLTNRFADFIIWRSPREAYRPSPFTNMGREENNLSFAPFLNYTDPERGITHKVKGRFYYANNNIVRPMETPDAATVLAGMGSDASSLQELFASGDLTAALLPAIQPALQGDLAGAAKGLLTGLGTLFPDATTADYCDLIASAMAQGGEETSVRPDHNYDYYLDYQFGKRFGGGAQLTAGATYEHVRYNSAVMDAIHASDNAALYLQYDQRFWDRLSLSAGVRAEYYRVDRHYREAATNLFGTSVPFRPVLRGGVNYQLADYSYLRASFGQGYRYPSLTEKFLLKDIGGVALYPNLDLKAEKGFNAEVGIKQGYRLGKLKGMVDLAGFYTQYDDMVEFYIGLFNRETYRPIDGITEALDALLSGNIGIGAQFQNVSKAQIYGAEVSTGGEYTFDKNTRLTYTLGYTYTEPRDARYRERNAEEDAYTDPLQMKQKSNRSPYLKYRQKHSAKGSIDFHWKRITLGTNLAWRSKTEAVDYFILDERSKAQPDLMDYIRDVALGDVAGENMAAYWARHNTGIFTMDLRLGIKATKEVGFQFLIDNLLNSEYSLRPMAVAAPRTFVVKLDLTL